MKIEKKTIYILIAVVIAIGLVGFWIYRGTTFSKEILRLEILGPDTAKVGDEIIYTVKYKNNGNFTLEKPKLIFQLPDNSLTEDGKNMLIQELHDIYPGAENLVKFPARLLGKQDDIKVARAVLSYVPHNLSARYESETTFITKIDSVPLTLTYDLPLKLEKNKEFNYTINYFSNIDYPLEGVSVKVDSVIGFTFESSDPKSLDNTEWKLGNINKGQGGKVKIKGVISADAGSDVTFSAKFGIWQSGIFVVIKEVTQDIQVIQPLLSISQHINGSSSHIASPGEKLTYEVFIRNIGSTPFNNVFVSSQLEGNAFDFPTLVSPNGQITANNVMVFDSKQISELKNILPQREVKVTFTVTLKSSWANSEKNNTVIKNKVNVLDTSAVFETKVNSRLEFAQKAYYASYDGMENSGPIPPTVGQATTYVIHWQIKNAFNDVKNIKVKAVLPEGVTLVDNIVPEDQASQFSFDSASREVIWLAGNLSSESETGLSFQVSLTPSASQKGVKASLVGQAIITAEDQFTGTISQSSALGVNTGLPDDQGNSGGGVVQ